MAVHLSQQGLFEMNSPAVTTPSPSPLAAVEAEIAAACKAASRERSTVELVAVSKTFARDAIEPVLRAGQRSFGENRVQEAKGKWPSAASPPDHLPQGESWRRLEVSLRRGQRGLPGGSSLPRLLRG